jgi:hypothetical protein
LTAHTSTGAAEHNVRCICPWAPAWHARARASGARRQWQCTCACTRTHTHTHYTQLRVTQSAPATFAGDTIRGLLAAGLTKSVIALQLHFSLPELCRLPPANFESLAGARPAHNIRTCLPAPCTLAGPSPLPLGSAGPLPSLFHPSVLNCTRARIPCPSIENWSFGDVGWARR